MSASPKAVFLSYASQDAAVAQRIRASLAAAGIEVWFDQSELRGGDAWDASIRRQIRECALFVALVSANTDARGEGYFRLEWKLAVERSHLMADDRPFLLPLVIDSTREDLARVPDRFRERQWMRLADGQVPTLFIDQVQRLVAPDGAATATAIGQTAAALAPASTSAQRLGVCVLPFANMSGEPEQEYFSDGITEDIITDLSKVSSLWVAARNTAFTFKGRHVDVLQVARQLKTSHVLEGSVRKSGRRVRITAQLIDGATGGHVWAERYDRDLDDIFSLQDEISQAIVVALKCRLLPEEKQAIEQRGTVNSEAYKLYLLARQFSLSGNVGSARSSEAIVRICHRATQIDPGYARAWALMASAQCMLRIMLSREGDGGLAAAERALALDADLAEAHAVKARILTAERRFDDAGIAVGTALRLDPASYEVNNAAARWYYATRDFRRAAELFDRAASDTESDYYAAGMLPGCYELLGDKQAELRAAHRALARCELAVAREPDNGSAMGFLVTSLAHLGETERMREWIERATLLDPDNINQRYNLACVLIRVVGDHEAGLDLLATILAACGADSFNWMGGDADLDPVREHARFKAMFAAAEARLAAVAAAHEA
ncbi:MAG: repeat-containing protein YrrB [Pseudomonadota bacterium]|jgi:adenylate cyclase